MPQEVGEDIQEQIQEIANRILKSVKDLETLEIYAEQPSKVHLAFKTDKSDNIPSLVGFLDDIDQEMDPEEGLKRSLCESEFIYKNEKYTFNRITSITEDFISVILISRDPINGYKRGLILFVDASGVVVIATCKSDVLRQFNLDLTSILDPS
ncbi:uncharacterized protein VICG_01459 [Vittaforma corneae ATCC 50505]|uniref:Uncharacterized protein n=1 Tax=Vittaforma corneae (strain ATCC 50505) TaxID=993615 RepID=L2GLU2_VITCO|nr:uncharacterized protein VICG_01459 [Vittaforma corneae ATCC 50505]ELA41475.1 hypothetical protein VICG_01459 [Vittaforma corneae ATCC 50505]